MDLLYLAGIAAFTGVCVALTQGCERLRRRSSGARS
ncbi:potassium ABC transporter ATPase [Caballeronia sp. Lep1P3]|nr:potassium ABC transporter ATPase [Caballeronia sp. Lep1P3]